MKKITFEEFRTIVEDEILLRRNYDVSDLYYKGNDVLEFLILHTTFGSYDDIMQELESYR